MFLYMLGSNSTVGTGAFSLRACMPARSSSVRLPSIFLPKASVARVKPSTPSPNKVAPRATKPLNGLDVGSLMFS